MNKISFNINNNEKIELVQREHDGKVLISYSDKDIENPDNLAFISPGDFVMMINYYRYVKRNDFQNDFINPTGKKQRIKPAPRLGRSVMQPDTFRRFQALKNAEDRKKAAAPKTGTTKTATKERKNGNHEKIKKVRSK